MTRGYTTVIGMVVAAALVGCSSISVRSDFDATANFAGYESFAFMSEHPMIITQASGGVNPLTEGRFMDAISAQLKAKGLRQVDDPEAADVAVSFTLGSREKISVDSYPTSYRAGYGGWGWGRSYYQDVQVRDYTEGQFALDLYDVERHAPVWHGVATKTITTSDREAPAPVINEIVAEVLAEYPPAP